MVRLMGQGSIQDGITARLMSHDPTQDKIIVRRKHQAVFSVRIIPA